MVNFHLFLCTSPVTSPAQVLYKSCTSPGKSCSSPGSPVQSRICQDKPWSLQVLAEDALYAVLCIKHSGPFCLYLDIQTKCLPRMLCVLCLCLHQTGEGINFASPCKCLLRMLSVLSGVSGIQAPSTCTLKCNPNAGQGCSVCCACVSTRQVKD